MMPYLWKRIRLARRKAGLNQTQIANACGVSQVAVVYWEKSPTTDHANEVGIESLLRIAQLTNTPVQWFFEDGDPDYAKPVSNIYPSCISLADVEAESECANQLAIRIRDPDDVSYREPLVDAYRLHLALGIATPYQVWFQALLASRLFPADQHSLVEETDYWSMAVAQTIALLTGTARGFAVWRMLVQLNAQYSNPSIAPLSNRQLMGIAV